MALVRAGVTAFFGQTQTGKTTLMAGELELSAERGLIFDPSADATLDRYPELTNPAQVRRFLSSPASAGPWIVTVRGSLELYAWLAASVESWRGITWVIDDSPALFTVPAIINAAERVAIAGRHMGGRAGVELWVVSQRPMLVPVTIRSQALRIRCFAQDEPNDIQYLRGKAGKTFADTILSLRGHRYAAWPEGSAYERATGALAQRLARSPGTIPLRLHRGGAGG